MSAQGNGKRRVVVVNPAEYPCPACGRTDRWEGAYEDPEDPRPSMIVYCDCGIGELKIITE